MSETNAPIGQWESIKKNFAESVIKMFPISGRKNTLEIQEVTFDESKADPQDIRAREIAKHQEKTWGIPVFAKFTLRDKATGQVINESKQKLAVLPRLTPLDTYIVSGGEWNSAYQWRLKSGIYAKITDAGKLETEFNLNGAGKDFARESRLKIPFDPETKQFKFKYGTVSTPLYSILKANDVSDDTMKKAWGDDIFNANFKKNWQQDVTKLYNTKLKKRGLLAESDSFEHIKSAIVKEFNKAEVLPETTKLTIGKEVKNLDGNALLAGSTHILGVSRGNKPDDVYSLYFKHLLGLDDFIAEKFGASKTAQAIKSKIRNTLDKKEKVSQILANDLFSKPLSQVFIGNTLSQRPDQVNPIDILSSKSITTITGPGGISSSHAIRNPMKIISQSHLAMLDPILTPECFTPDAEVLTSKGYKRIDEVTYEDDLACSINGKLEFHKPEKVHAYDYEGDMYGVTTNEIAYLVTPNHRIRFSEEGITYQVKEAKEMYHATFFVESDIACQLISRNEHYKQSYKGKVHCVTVPGGFVYTKYKDGTGFWIGNSESTGITLHLPIGAKKVGREAQTLVYDLLHKKFKHINPAELHGSYTVLPDQIKWKGGVPQPIAKENGNGKVTAVDPLTHEFTEVPLEKARYVLPSPRNFFSEATNLIPFLQCNQGNRTMTGSRQPAQGVALKYKEAPLVQVRSNDPTKSFEHVFGQKFSHQSPADGKVVAVVKDNLGYTNEIHVEDKTGKVHKTQIYNNFPLNDKKAFLHADPVVEVGQTVTRGQQIADSNFSDKGTLAVGTNLHVGYMPYGAFTFEDGIVVSESGAKKLTSEHLHKTSLELDPKNDKVSLSKFISHISSVGKKLKKDKVANLDENGIIKPGSIVKPGDLLVTAISKNTIEGQLASMASKMKGATSAYKDKSLVWDHDYEGKVVKVIPKPGNNGYTVYVRTSEPAKIGDKICYDEETEVLTSTGWKFVKDVSLEDEVCTLNPSTDHIEYHSPTQLHYYPTGGEMYYVENSNLNFFVTTDHNMYVKKRGKKTFEFVPARELVGKRVSYKKNGIWKGSSPEKVVFPELEVKAGQFGHGVRTLPKLEMPTKSFMFLLGAFLSEGNCLNQPKTGSYGIEITQIKPAFRAKLIKMLEEQNLTFGVTEEKIRIFSKQLLMYFKQFGKCHQKYIPQEIFSYAKEDLEVLFEWLMWGDGTSINGRPVCYYSTSKQLADDVQKLALHIGKAANLQLGTPAKVQTIKGKQYNCRDCWEVRIINTKLEPTVNHGHVRTQNVQQEYVVQNYEKPVYCLTVNNHVIYTRRTGKTAWSINCGRSGDKNIIGAIIPDEHMPRVGGKDGQIFDLLTAPSGVVSRINLGQLLEMGASKIAKKTGQPYVTTNFAPGVDYTEKIKKEMAAHGISDTDRVYDPLLGKEVEGDVLTGYKYIIKQKHQVEKKESVRGLDQALSGKYSTNFDPQRGKGEGAQAISPLDLYALLGHGARANLKEMSSYKAELQHDTATGMHTDGDFWNRVMLGMPLKPPKPTFAYRKFEGYLTGLGINLKKEGNTTVLTPLTDKGVLALSNGEIKEADQIRGKDDQEIKGGLFDPKITGGIADAPGKGMHWSHLKLAEPYPNPIFVGTLHLPGPAAVLSGLPFKQFEQVAKGQEDIVVNGKSLTGGKAIEEILKRVNVKKDLESIKKQLPLLKGSELNKANKKAKFLQALDRLNMRPEEAYIMNHVPILPPVFRPITVLPDGSSTSADANTLYKSLILLNNGLKEKEVLRNFPDKEKELRSSTYDALKALIGLGKVPSYDGNKKLKGLLQTVAGDSPKTGFFQSKVMKRRQELSMRSTIIPGPDMGIDQIGLPKNAAMELYKPFVIRELVRSGKDLIEATKDVKEGTSMAWKALDNAIKNRPVLVKRDPVLHKYNVQALLPKLIEGSAIAMHPLLANSFNFDHDGNCYVGNSEILLKIGYNTSVDDPKQFLQEKYQMKFTKTTQVVATTPEGAIVSLHIEDMPRYEEGKILDKNGAWIYPVPSGISVWSYDHSRNTPIFAPITGLTVEQNCPTVNVETRRFKVTASPNESLCVYDNDTQEVRDICPKDAIGKLCPVVTQIPSFGIAGNTELGWLLGAFVSDGSISGKTITCTKLDKQYRDRFYNALTTLQAEPVTRHSYEEYHDETCSIKGMSAKDHFGNINKNILEMFKSCYSEEMVEGRSCLRKQLPLSLGTFSREALVGVLSGLFDGDGSLSVSHGKKKPQPVANFATSSRFLVNSVELLCKLLNIRTSTSSSEPREGRLQTHTSYLVSLSINDLAQYADELTVLGEKKREVLHLLKTQERRDIVDIIPVPTFVMNIITTSSGPMKGHELFKSLGTVKSNRKASYYMSRDMANIIFPILVDANIRNLERWKEVIDATNVHWDLVVSVTENQPETVYDLVVPSTKVFAVNGGLIVWDTMAVHLPLTEQARQEALDKMLPSSNLFSATNYGIMHAPDQEAIIGINNLSHWGQKKELSFNSLADLKKNKDIKVSDVVKVKIGSEYKETTKGRALLVENAPLEMDHSKLLHDPSLELKKSSIHKMLETFARKDPKGYPTLVDDWRKKGNERAHEMGFSFSLSDLSPLKAKRNAILAPYHEEVAKVNKSSLSQDNKDAKIVALYNKATEELDEKLSKDYKAMGNNMFKMVDTKARGSLAQFRQTVIAPMLLVDANNKVITTPVLNSYSEGLNVSQYWTSLHGARKGTLQRAQGTSVPGALAKELINLNIATPITKHDCGDEHGLEMKLIDKKGNNEIDVTDRFLAKDEHGFHKGTLITPEVFGKLKANNVSSVTVRSPLTCKVPQGICSTCFGLNENGHKHEIGTNIGVLASQALSEPAVQLAMDCSADGNLVSVKVNGLITTLTFEQLWEHIGGFTSEDDGIETKMPINLEVWDHNKWVEVRTFQRHKVDEPMVLVRTSSGRSFIVKATHPSWAVEDTTETENRVFAAKDLLNKWVPVSSQQVDTFTFNRYVPVTLIGLAIKKDIELQVSREAALIKFNTEQLLVKEQVVESLIEAKISYTEQDNDIVLTDPLVIRELALHFTNDGKLQLPMGFLGAPLQWKTELLESIVDFPVDSYSVIEDLNWALASQLQELARNMYISSSLTSTAENLFSLYIDSCPVKTDIGYDKVTSIEPVLYDGWTYDFSTATKSYTTNGITTHNSFHCLHLQSLLFVRNKGKNFVCDTLENLFNTCSSTPYIEGEEEVKDLVDMEVFADGKWIALTHVKRHKPTSPMVLIGDGHNINIAQDTHPMFVYENKVSCVRCGYHRLKLRPNKEKSYCPKCMAGQDTVTDKVGKEQIKEIKDITKKRVYVKHNLEPLLQTAPVEDPVYNGYLIGMFLAEGCVIFGDKINPTRVTISQNEGEIKDYTKKLASNFWNVKENNKALIVNSPVLAREFHSAYGRYARNKGLPNTFLSYSKEWLVSFLAGYIDGDGTKKWTNDGPDQICIDTTSFKMAQQLSFIAMKLGVSSSICATSHRKLTRHQAFRVTFNVTAENALTLNESFKVRKLVKHTKSSVVSYKGQRLVQTIKPVLYTDEYVYDVTTEDHSLIIGGLLTHNSGGVAQSRGGGSSSKLERLSQLLNLPKGLPYSATLAKHNGVIHSVEKDTAGGHKVFIQNNTGVHEHYVPSTLDLTVEKGHEVKRGEAISNGPVNPHQLLQLKDMGAVRKYLTTEMGDMYKDVGGVRRRNVEVVVKNLTNLTEVVSSGSSDHLPGDILSTAIVDAHNRTVPTENRILHKPILRGIKETALLKDEDYLSKMNFQRIQNTVIEGVGKGWKTTTKDTLSPLPAWAAGTIDVQKDKNNPKY